MKLAHELADGPTVALSLIRRFVLGKPRQTRSRISSILEQQMQRRAGAAEDFKEGVAAFLEKRPAKFKGK